MGIAMQPVNSGMIESIGYDPDAQELHVCFKSNQRIVVYSAVPLAVAEAVIGAGSVGKALHAMVIHQYDHRYL